MSGDQLTLLPAESLASLSVWPGSKQAQQMTVTSGQRLLEYSRLCGPVGSALKTLAASSAWRSTMCLLTWKHKVTPQGRSYFQLQLSVPRTNGTGSGLSPAMFQSPMPSDVDGGRTTKGKHRQNETGLRKQAMFGTPMANNKARSAEFAEGRTPNLRELEKREQAMWPTPRHEGFDAGAHRGNPDSLHSAVKMLHTPTSTANQLCPSMVNRDSGSYGHGMLPTPNARDYKDTGPNVDYERVAAKSKLTGVVMVGERTMLPTPDANPEKYRLQGDSQQSHSLEAQSRRGDWGTQPGLKLNPDWVSRMMGFPDGWLSLDYPNTIALLAQGRALQDWAWREDGTKVRVFKVQGQPWQEGSRKTRAGRATP